MKKRLFLILAVGIAFSPSAFALGLTGSFNKATQAGTAGAIDCPLAAQAEMRKQLHDGSDKADSDNGTEGTQSNQGS
jgi:hypothetical protein